MPRKAWPLRYDCPSVEVVLTMRAGGQALPLHLLADTGAGSAASAFELILDESDCLLCGGRPLHAVRLGGAYAGVFPVYVVRAQIPDLMFDQSVRAAGVPAPPPHFHGMACFPFLNRFTYGNFGDPGQFGLET